MADLPPRPAFLDGQAYENVCHCLFTTSDEKKEYLLALDAVVSADDASAEHDRLRQGRLRLGPPPRDVRSGECFGNLMSKSAFVRHTAKLFSMGSAEFESKVNNWIVFCEKEALGVNATDTERLAAVVFRRASIPCRQDGEFWLFRGFNRSPQPYEGVDLGELTSRLGLEDNCTRLTFAFKATSVIGLARPRFYDPKWSALRLWDWRGKTKPLEAQAEGLDELVSEPPMLQDVFGRVREV